MVVNCAIWSGYGFLMAPPGAVADMTVLTPNAIGLAIGLVYSGIFAQHCPAGTLPKWVAGSSAILAAMGAAVATLPVEQARVRRKGGARSVPWKGGEREWRVGTRGWRRGGGRCGPGRW